MICLAFSVILLFFLQMTGKWCYRDPNQVAFSSLSSARTWATWDLPINPKKCLTVGKFPPFLWLFLRQTPIIRSPRLTASEALGFPLTQLSPWQCTAERLLIQKDDCFSWPAVRSKRTIQSSLYPSALCLCAATPRVREGSQLPKPES